MKFFKILYIALILIGIGCSKSDFSSILYEPDERNVAQEIKDRYDLLINNEDGWYFVYKPSDKSDSIFMHLEFLDENQYNYTVDREDYLSPTNSSYEIRGTYDAELSFDETSIWGTLKDQYHGATKFHILFDDNQVFLRRSDGFDGRKFELKPMTTIEQQLFAGKVQEERDRIAYREHLLELSRDNIIKIQKLASLDQAYFNNIQIGDHFFGMFDLDTISQEITISWYGSSGISQASSNYSISPWGISFDNTLDLNGMTVDSLNLGDFTNNRLMIAATGSIPEGVWSQDHSPSFVYPIANEYLFRMQESGFQARWQFVAADGIDNIGPDLQIEHQAILDMGLTFGGYNLFINNRASGYNRYGFTATLNGAAHYMWHQDITEEPDNSLIITQDNTVPENSLGNSNFNNLSAERKTTLKAFYQKLLNGGIYVWPNGRASNGNQSVRLVNKVNSKIYLTMKWIPNGSYPTPSGFID